MREELRRRPRHVLLWAFATGLPLAAAAPAVALAVAAALRLARAASPVTAVLAAGAVVLGGHAGAARVDALERTALPVGRDVSGHATLTAAPRADRYGNHRALARLDGEPVVLRWAPWLPAPVHRVGEVLAVSGSLAAPDRGARALHAHATLRLRRAAPTGMRRGGLHGAVDRVRDRAQEVLRRGPPAADAALLEGMVLGQDAALPDDVRDDLRAAGLAHLVAASGQNVALLAALAMVAGALVGMPIRPRLVATAGLVGLYVLLAGAGPSIQRAGIMGAAVLVALAAGRPPARWYALGLAAAGTLALDPRAVGDPGWQMSFAAVLALILLAPGLRAALRQRGAPGALADATAVALCATLATAPIAAAHFGRASLVSVPANVLATPAVAPATWLGMAAAAVGQVSPGAASPLAALAATPAAYVRWVGQTAAGVPGADVEAPALLVAALAGLALAPLAVVALRHAARLRAAAEETDLRRRGLDPALVGLERGVASARPAVATRVRSGSPPRRAAGVLAALALAAIGVALLVRPHAAPAGPPRGVVRFTVADVGQGSATLVQAGGAAVLVDAGPQGSDLPGLLDAAGVERLDVLVLSHGAADHVGGAPAVTRAVPTDLLIDGRDGDRSPAGRVRRVTVARAGRRVVAGPIVVRVLAPGPGPPAADQNERAAVVTATAHGTTALLPADAESPQLLALDLPPADLLAVPHHGSADPGLPAILERTAPDVAVVSAGRRNPYGHPAPPTLAALRARVPRVLRTDRDGTVVLEGRDGRLAAYTRPR